MEYEAGPDGYGGGPSVPTLLPHFGKHVACRVWVDANVSNFTSFIVYLTYSIYYFMLEIKFMLEYI